MIAERGHPRVCKTRAALGSTHLLWGKTAFHEQPFDTCGRIQGMSFVAKLGLEFLSFLNERSSLGFESSNLFFNGHFFSCSCRLYIVSE